MPYNQDNYPASPTQEQNPSSSEFPEPKKGHVVALGVTLTLVGLVLISIIAYFTVRMRRTKAEQDQEQNNNREVEKQQQHVHLPTRKSTILDSRHPASRVTPFGTRKPGENMRIAKRRQDGAWDFEDPGRQSYTPGGVKDPSPSSPISPTLSTRSTATTSKYAEARAERDSRRDTNCSDVSGIEAPPPAYIPTEEGYSGRKD